MSTGSGGRGSGRNRHSKTLEADQRRAKAIVLAEQGVPLRELLDKVPISYAGYSAWRQRHAGFGAQFDAARAKAKQRANTPFDGGFVSFRWHYLGMPTTWFQAEAAKAIEEAKEGEITLVLWPPEHGKTTLVEDYCTFKLCTDFTYRITAASGNVSHPKKILGRVKNRMEPDGPTPKIAADFGPLAPTEGRSSQIWAATKFNIARKLETDERDYSMSAIGLKGAVQGTRSDLMLLDDIQSVHDLAQSDTLFEIIVQDFLSRPSVFGRTVIVGTRVGEFDVYRRLIDAGIVDNLIVFPAYSVSRSPSWPAPATKPRLENPDSLPPPGVEFLWGDRYTPLQYAQLRHRVGEIAWWRNYMQRPEAAGKMTFPESLTDLMKDESRSSWSDPAPLEGGNKVPMVISLDPAIGGGNAIGAFAMRPTRLELHHCRLDYDLVSNRQIFDMIEDYAWTYTTDTSKVVEVIIEDKAFQKGLLRDDRALELQELFGFRLVGHTTGRDKMDSDIGVPSLEQSIRRREISIPWASEVDEAVMEPLLHHMWQWRPNVPGNKLAMDMVMMLWFAHTRWRMHRALPTHPGPDANAWKAEASPLRRRRRPPARRPVRVPRTRGRYFP